MADKHHSGVLTKKKQRELEEQQRKVFGYPEKGETDYSKNVVFFDNKEVDSVCEKTLEQNGRIESQMTALDRDSRSKPYYEQASSINKSFLEAVRKAKEDNQ